MGFLQWRLFLEIAELGSQPQGSIPSPPPASRVESSHKRSVLPFFIHPSSAQQCDDLWASGVASGWSALQQRSAFVFQVVPLVLLGLWGAHFRALGHLGAREGQPLKL